MKSKFDASVFLANLTTLPGIYQMYDEEENILYIGKARNLKKRVTSYFQRALDAKTTALMQQVQDIKVTITSSDNEALLLESNLIKQYKPRYNILLRDDKSYPYLYLSDHKDFPRLDVHRGPKKEKGQYFGPFPSAGSVRETLALLQKLFKIRQCSDHFFSLRARPCLQYFIKRCTAPCVNYVDAETYQRDVHYAVLFLQGRNEQVIEELAAKMEEASENMDYEEAARYRDQIVSLRRIQEKQFVSRENDSTDIIAVMQKMENICIQVLTVRGGRLIGGKSYFPKMPADTKVEEALAAFLPQYYFDPIRGDSLPKNILINVNLDESDWIEAALSEQLQRKINLSSQLRGIKRQWMQLAITNAEHALVSHLADKVSYYQRFEALQSALNLANLPQRAECFDVSHTLGESTVASCVVFDLDGPSKKDYRKFNIKNVKKGDDYAAMAQALSRRYTKLKAGEGVLPDLLIIDGGKGQLTQAENVLEELQISGVILLAVAKGPERKPGLETLYLSGRNEPIHLSSTSTALHLIQQIRDEAHRFAITGHRKQRAKTRNQSILDEIPGIGAKRRRELLRQFGGLQELKRAGVDDFVKVPGINRDLAQRIFDYLHR